MEDFMLVEMKLEKDYENIWIPFRRSGIRLSLYIFRPSWRRLDNLTW